MPRLSLAILGTFQAMLDSHPLYFRGWKERALLAYLATESESVHERNALVALLWSNMKEAQGLTNLRLTLSRLRQSLRDMDVGGFITVTRTGLRWNPAAPAEVDLHTFRRAVEPPIIATATSTTDPLGGLPLEANRLKMLSHAVSLYRGDFLTGFDGEDEEPFVEWSRVWRERLHQQVLSALYALAENALQRGDYAMAEQYAYRQVGLERWREEAHRQLMQALASLGHRTAALHQYDTLEQIVAEELGVSPDPVTTALYEQIRDGHFPPPPEKRGLSPTPVVLAPTKVATSLPEISYRPPTNLPTPLTPFMGREQEQAFVLNRIRERGERLVTLVGEGGIGKSRLATALGHQLLSDFPQGVWWVSLAELEPNPDHPDETLADCIARTFSLPLNGQDSATTQIFTYLHHKQMLLILDNFESIYAAAPTVLTLVERCPQVSVLVTTREALHYQAEIILRVEGLPLPPATDPDPLTYSSVRLLVERAERTGWQLNPRRVDEIAHLCRFLRGVPLALELAATLVGDMSPRTLLDDLQQGYDLLATTMRDVPPRHRTIQAIFETSWQLLAPHHQVILAQLAIFRGRFDTAAAEAVAIAGADDLHALVAKSLVRQDSDGWFSLHDHLRDFAHRQWQAFDATTANGHFNQLRESPARHAAYYLGWLASATDLLYGEALPTTLKQIQEQRANLYQAWQWAIQQKAWGLIAPAIAPLRRALHIMADLRDGVRLFETLLSALNSTDIIYLDAVAASIQFLTRIGQTATALELVSTTLAYPDLPATRHADLLMLHADLLLSGEQVNRTDAIYQQALSLAQRVDNRRLEVTILVSACSGAWMRNDYPYAQRYADAALPLAREVGDLWAEVSILNRLGVLSINQQYGLTTAQDYFSRGLVLARLLNDRQTEGTLLGNIGVVSEYQMDFASALTTYQAGLALQSERGNLQATALSHTNVGRLFYMVGDYAVARPYMERALHFYTESNSLRGQGLAQTYLGAVLNHLDELPLAITHLEQATQIFRTLDLIPFLPFAITYLGESHYRLGNYAHAESFLNEAAQIRRDIADTILLKDTLALLVQLHLAQGTLQALPPLLAELAENIDKTDDVGAEHLVADYVALYEGQRALHDPTADQTLATARDLFAKILAMMPDPAMRDSYRAIPAHQVLGDSA
jgi:predicted ATPase/DNA-binding SARP family transcriptional activator